MRAPRMSYLKSLTTLTLPKPSITTLRYLFLIPSPVSCLTPKGHDPHDLFPMPFALFFQRLFSWSKFMVSRDIWKLLIGQNTDKHPDYGYQLHISNASWLNTVDGLYIERINEQFSLNWDSQEFLSEVLAKRKMLTEIKGYLEISHCFLEMRKEVPYLNNSGKQMLWANHMKHLLCHCQF